MAVDIHITGQLKSATAGVSSFSVSGQTISEVLEALCVLHTGLRDKLFEATGVKRKTVNIYVNKNDIRYLKGLDTAVSDGDEIIILPPASGG